MATKTASSHISREDIETTLRSLQGDLKNKIDGRKPSILAIASGVGVVVVVVFFLLGKRSGKRRSTVVEIRRL